MAPGTGDPLRYHWYAGAGAVDNAVGPTVILGVGGGTTTVIDTVPFTLQAPDEAVYP